MQATTTSHALQEQLEEAHPEPEKVVVGLHEWREQHHHFTKIQQTLMPLTNALLEGRRLHCGKNGTLEVATKDVSAETPEAAEAALSLIQQLNQALDSAGASADTQYMNGLFSELKKSEWLMKVVHCHPDVAQALQETVSRALPAGAQSSRFPLNEGIAWLHVLPSGSQARKKMHEALTHEADRCVDMLVKLHAQHEQTQVDKMSFNAGEHIIEALLEEGISPQERAHRAETYIRLCHKALERGEIGIATMIVRALTAQGVFRLLDPGSEANLFPMLSTEAQGQFHQLIQANSQGKMPFKLHQRPGHASFSIGQQRSITTTSPFMRDFANTSSVKLTSEVQEALVATHKKASEQIMAGEETVRDIGQLHTLSCSLRDNKKLTLTPEGLQTTERLPNFLSFLGTRIGASKGAYKAAANVLENMRSLAQKPGLSGSERILLQHALLALGQSKWFKGVLRHHPQVSALFFATAKAAAPATEEFRPMLLQLAGCVAGTKEAQDFAGYASGECVTVERLEERMDTQAARIDDVYRTLSISEFNDLALLKKDLDAMAATATSSDIQERVQKLQDKLKDLSEYVRVHAETAMSNLEDGAEDVETLHDIHTFFDALRDLSTPSPVPGSRAAPKGEATSRSLVSGLDAARQRCMPFYLQVAHTVLEMKPVERGGHFAYEEANFEDVYEMSEDLMTLPPQRDVTSEEAQTVSKVRAQCEEHFERLAFRLLETAFSGVDRATRENALDEFEVCIARVPEEKRTQIYERFFPLTMGNILESDATKFERGQLALPYFLRGLSLQQRESIVTVLAKLPEEERRESTLEIVRQERMRTTIAMSCDPILLKRELQGLPEDKAAALKDEARFAPLAITAYAATRGEVSSILLEMLSQPHEGIELQALGHFALVWARANLSAPPPAKESHRAAFEQDSQLIKQRLLLMSHAFEPINPSLASQLREVATAEPSHTPQLTPGEISASATFESAIHCPQGSSERTTAVKLFAGDLFGISASLLRSINPAALAAVEIPGEAVPGQTRYFNKLSAYVTGSILKDILPLTKVEDRLTEIHNRARFWLDVANDLLERGDMHSAQAILAALANSSVSRLISDPQISRRMKQLEDKTSAQSSYKVPRAWIRERLALGAPVIPYMGMFLTDTTFIRDGNIGKPATIHLHGRVIEQVHQSQASLEVLPPQKQLTTLSSELPAAQEQSDHDYELSLQIRPRHSSPTKT
jgi:hypothetical protein